MGRLKAGIGLLALMSLGIAQPIGLRGFPSIPVCRILYFEEFIRKEEFVNSGFGQIETKKPYNSKTLALTKIPDLRYTFNVSKLNPNPHEDVAGEKKVKGERKGIIGITLSVNISSIGWVGSYYSAVGVKFFRFLDILAGTGKFGAATWGGVIRYDYWMIGVKAQIPFFSLSKSLSVGHIFFSQLGIEYGWGTGSWKDEKG